MERDPLTERVIGCAIEVHRFFGPGLLESAYEPCLARELALQGLGFELQVPEPVSYQRVRLDCGYRIDILVERQWILELKAVEAILGIHKTLPAVRVPVLMRHLAPELLGELGLQEGDPLSERSGRQFSVVFARRELN